MADLTPVLVGAGISLVSAGLSFLSGLVLANRADRREQAARDFKAVQDREVREHEGRKAKTETFRQEYVETLREVTACRRAATALLYPFGPSSTDTELEARRRAELAALHEALAALDVPTTTLIIMNSPASVTEPANRIWGAYQALYLKAYLYIERKQPALIGPTLQYSGQDELYELNDALLTAMKAHLAALETTPTQLAIK